MKYTEIFNKAIEKMVEDIDFELNVRELFPELSPSDVEEILGELGWHYEMVDTNGWEQDTSYSFYNENYSFKLSMYYSGFYWSLFLFREDRG